MADFVEYPQDEFNPEFGGVNWKPRLNALLEARDVQLTPVGYKEDGKDVMQVNQTNAIIYINQVADEMDCVAIKYDQDEEDIWTWYFREKFKDAETFSHVVGVVGPWAMQCITMYPMEHVVTQYETFLANDLDTVPDWLE